MVVQYRSTPVEDSSRVTEHLCWVLRVRVVIVVHCAVIKTSIIAGVLLDVERVKVVLTPSIVLCIKEPGLILRLLFLTPGGNTVL